MKVEPRAVVNPPTMLEAITWVPFCNGKPLKPGVELTTVADVLAALRQPSEAMIAAGDKKYEGTLIVEEAFLAMLDQFEKEQSA